MGKNLAMKISRLSVSCCDLAHPKLFRQPGKRNAIEYAAQVYILVLFPLGIFCFNHYSPQVL